MTTPTKKKSSAQSGGTGSKSGGSKGSAAKGSSPSSAKTGGAKKAAPKKKRASKKKKKGGVGKWLALAFAAGIILSVTAFWLLRDVSLTDLVAGVGPRTQQLAAGDRDTPKTAPVKGQSEGSGKTGGKAGDKAGDKAGGKAGKASAVEKRPAPRTPDKPAAGKDGRTKQAERTQQAEGKKEGNAAPSGGLKTGEERGSSTGSAVASALIDLQSLPYEESLDAPLDERIRQVDYALMQAAWMRKLPARALRLVSVEDRLEGVEPYQFQVIDILPGKDAREFTGAVKDCLAAWAEGATLVEAGRNVWAVSVGGVHTHSIRLYPGKDVFPPLPGQSAGPPSGADAPSPPVSPDRQLAPHPAMPAPRLRASGEDARLVIVIDDLGANPKATERLLALNYPVTFAFWPHGKYTKQGARAAHAKGREVLVHQPMEPVGYPRVQPGPGVLLTGMGEARIRALVEEGIRAVPHATGLNNHMGSRFTQSREGVDAVIRVLQGKGLFMLDSLTHGKSVFAAEGRRLGIQHYRRNVFLDTAHTKSSVLAALRRAERIALLSGHAVAIGHPLPQTLDALREWQQLRNKDVRIVRLRDLPGD